MKPWPILLLIHYLDKSFKMKIKPNSIKPKHNRFLMAYNTSSGFYDLVFHLGYQGCVMPRVARKVLAKPRLHRAWFSGFTGLGILSIVELTKPLDMQ